MPQDTNTLTSYLHSVQGDPHRMLIMYAGITLLVLSIIVPTFVVARRKNAQSPKALTFAHGIKSVKITPIEETEPIEDDENIDILESRLNNYEPAALDLPEWSPPTTPTATTNREEPIAEHKKNRPKKKSSFSIKLPTFFGKRKVTNDLEEDEHVASEFDVPSTEEDIVFDAPDLAAATSISADLPTTLSDEQDDLAALATPALPKVANPEEDIEDIFDAIQISETSSFSPQQYQEPLNDYSHQIDETSLFDNDETIFMAAPPSSEQVDPIYSRTTTPAVDADDEEELDLNSLENEQKTPVSGLNYQHNQNNSEEDIILLDEASADEPPFTETKIDHDNAISTTPPPLPNSLQSRAENDNVDSDLLAQISDSVEPSSIVHNPETIKPKKEQDHFDSSLQMNISEEALDLLQQEAIARANDAIEAIPAEEENSFEDATATQTILKTVKWPTFVGATSGLGESERRQILRFITSQADPETYTQALVKALEEENSDGLRPLALQALVTTYLDVRLTSLFTWLCEEGSDEERTMAASGLEQLRKLSA